MKPDNKSDTSQKQETASAEKENKNITLFDLVNKSQLELLKLKLNHGINPNIIDDKHRTPLHFCAKLGNVPAARILLDYDANLDALDYQNETPLDDAVRNHQEAMVDFFLNKNANISHKNTANYSTLDIAKIWGNKKILYLVVQKIQKTNSNFILLNEPREIENFKNGLFPSYIVTEEEKKMYSDYILIYIKSYPGAKEITDINKIEASSVNKDALLTNSKIIDYLIENTAYNDKVNFFKYKRILLEKKRNWAKKVTKMFFEAIKSNDFSKFDFLLKAAVNPNWMDDQHRTSLHFAAKQDIYFVRKLLENGAIIDVQDDQGNTPLHVAVKNNNLSAVKILLENGADINLKNDANFTSIDVAVESGSGEQILEQLIQRKQVDNPLYILLDKYNELYEFKKNNKYPEWINTKKTKTWYSEKARIYLEIFSNPTSITSVEEIKKTKRWKRYNELNNLLLSAKRESINKKLKESNKMIILSIKNNNLNDFLSLVEKEFDPNYKDDFSYTMAHWAAKNEDTTYLSILKIKKANFEIPDINNNTAIFSAIDENNIKAIEYFLHVGVNLNHKNNDKLNPYEYSIKNSLDLKITEIIANEMANKDHEFFYLDGKKEIYNYKNFNIMPYWISSRKDKEAYKRRADLYIEQYPNEEEIIYKEKMKDNYIFDILTKTLIKSKKEWNSKNKSYDSFKINQFINAYMLNGPVKVNYLSSFFGYGANPNYLDKNNRSFLHWAVLLNDKDILNAFVENGALLDVIDNQGNTPLHIAALAGRYISVDYLIEKGAGIFIKNKLGFTALDLASFSKSTCNVYKIILDKIKEQDSNFIHEIPEDIKSYTLKETFNEIYKYTSITKISSGYSEPFASEVKGKYGSPTKPKVIIKPKIPVKPRPPIRPQTPIEPKIIIRPQPPVKPKQSQSESDLSHKSSEQHKNTAIKQTKPLEVQKTVDKIIPEKIPMIKNILNKGADKQRGKVSGSVSKQKSKIRNLKNRKNEIYNKLNEKKVL